MTTYTLTEIQIQSLLKKLERYQRKRQDFETFAEDIVFLINLQPNTQEPVAYVSRIAENGRADISWLQGVSVGDKLFTHPAPQAKPLTEDRIAEIFATCHKGYVYPQDNISGPRAMRITEARAIEAAHGIGVKP